MHSKAHGAYLQNDMEYVWKYNLKPSFYNQYSTEFQINAASRYICRLKTAAVRLEVNRRCEREVLKFIKENNIQLNASLLSGLFMLSVKQPGTESEL